MERPRPVPSLRREVRLEDVRQRGRVNAWPGVGDLELHRRSPAALPPWRAASPRRARHRLLRVEQQVQHDLPHVRRVRATHRQVRAERAPRAQCRTPRGARRSSPPPRRAGRQSEHLGLRRGRTANCRKPVSTPSRRVSSPRRIVASWLLDGPPGSPRRAPRRCADRAEGIADLVREPGAELPERAELLAAHELLAHPVALLQRVLQPSGQRLRLGERTRPALREHPGDEAHSVEEHQLETFSAVGDGSPASAKRGSARRARRHRGPRADRVHVAVVHEERVGRVRQRTGERGDEATRTP